MESWRLDTRQQFPLDVERAVEAFTVVRDYACSHFSPTQCDQSRLGLLSLCFYFSESTTTKFEAERNAEEQPVFEDSKTTRDTAVVPERKNLIVRLR